MYLKMTLKENLNVKNFYGINSILWLSSLPRLKSDANKLERHWIPASLSRFTTLNQQQSIVSTNFFKAS